MMENNNKENNWSVLPERIPEFINAVESLKEEYHGVVGNSVVFEYLDDIIRVAEELRVNTTEITPEIPEFEGTLGDLDGLNIVK